MRLDKFSPHPLKHGAGIDHDPIVYREGKVEAVCESDVEPECLNDGRPTALWRTKEVGFEANVIERFQGQRGASAPREDTAGVMGAEHVRHFVGGERERLDLGQKFEKQRTAPVVRMGHGGRGIDEDGDVSGSLLGGEDAREEVARFGEAAPEDAVERIAAKVGADRVEFGLAICVAPAREACFGEGGAVGEEVQVELVYDDEVGDEESCGADKFCRNCVDRSRTSFCESRVWL